MRTSPFAFCPALCLALLLAACAAPGPASRHYGQPEGSPVRLGATVEEARAALGTQAAAQATSGSNLALELDTRGVQVYFDANGRVLTVRLRPPFDTPVMGVRIGDSAATVVQKMGKPAAQARAEGQTGYTYHPDAMTMLTYLVGADQKVETIYLVR